MASILIIDDDPQIGDLLKRLLEDEGHRVDTAMNGIEGISHYRTHQSDLVILDILMPEKEGLETIVELRRDFPGVKIIAMSAGNARAKVNLLDLARRLGAQHSLLKPFDLQTVIRLVDEALSGPEVQGPEEE